MSTQSRTVTGPVTWFISVGKIPGWEHDKFIQEYTVVHANMSRQVHKMLPAFVDYKQVIPDYDVSGTPLRDEPRREGWDALTVHIWSSMDILFAGFSDPGYRASAGKHVFSNTDDMVGGLSQVHAEHASPELDDVPHPRARVTVFHRKGAIAGQGDDETEQWLDSRLGTGKKLVEGDARLLRYRQYIDRTPADVLDKFSGTLFANGRWREFAAEEEYVFKNTQDAADFVNEHRQWIEAGQTPWIMTGSANVIWGKD